MWHSESTYESCLKWSENKNESALNKDRQRTKQGSTNLLVVGVLDEHVAELDLGAIDVLTSDKYWETSTTALPLEEGEDVAKLGREESGKDGERSLRRGRGKCERKACERILQMEAHHPSVELV